MPTNFVDNEASLLSLLRTEKGLPTSKVKSRKARLLFERLQQSGIINKQRKGAGSQFKLVNATALETFIKQEYPAGLSPETALNSPVRVQGVQQFQNSKKQKNLDFALLTVRGGATLTHAGKKVNLNQLTDTETSLCLKISTSKLAELSPLPCTIITVENPTAFFELERMLSRNSWQLAIYTAGKMSNILLEQLKHWYQQSHKIIHFGDYDYVGLLEFARILDCCQTASLYQPDALAEKLQRYGNTKLLEDQTEQHKTLLKKISQLPESKAKRELTIVHQLLQNSAKGMEQEALYTPDK